MPNDDLPASERFDVAIIGAGQAALATAWFLRRTGLSYVLLDAEDGAGGVANVDMGDAAGTLGAAYWEEKPTAVIHTGFQQQDNPYLPHCGFYCAGAYPVPYGRP